MTPNQRALMRFRRNKPAVISLCFLAALILLVVLWPWVAPYSWETISDAQFQPPSAKHWFGTDVHGRDLLTRVIFGARVSLLVGVVGAGVAFVIGVAWGAVSGYVGGRIDGMMMRFVDVLYSLPSIIFVIVLLTTLKEGATKWLTSTLGAKAAAQAPMLLLFAGLGAVSWLTMARIVRGQVLALRSRAFVDASRSLGASHARIIWRHILPNVWGIVIVYLTLTVPSVILYESFLSYLGLGIQPPMASWGSLVAEGAGQLNPIRIYWWLVVFPSAMLVTTLLALNFLGDGLRDAFDPKGQI
ncbi:MAG: ABC transporter permease [Verrucomicrobia bacterium]|nr:ABC transporter permease [Verrucomicrobiota bacterium]